MVNKRIALILYLHTLKINLSHIYVLQFLEEQELKHKLVSDLEKYGYYHNGVTEKGKELLEKVRSWKEEVVPLKPKKEAVVYSKEFEDFWENYPKTDSYGNVLGTRSLKKDKEKSFIEWQKLMKEYTPQQITKSLEVEVAVRTQKSIKEGKNEMSYLSNSYFYLKNRKFELYLGKEVPKAEERKSIVNTKDLF